MCRTCRCYRFASVCAIVCVHVRVLDVCWDQWKLRAWLAAVHSGCTNSQKHAVQAAQNGCAHKRCCTCDKALAAAHWRACCPACPAPPAAPVTDVHQELQALLLTPPEGVTQHRSHGGPRGRALAQHGTHLQQRAHKDGGSSSDAMWMQAQDCKLEHGPFS